MSRVKEVGVVVVVSLYDTETHSETTIEERFFRQKLTKQCPVCEGYKDLDIEFDDAEGWGGIKKEVCNWCSE